MREPPKVPSWLSALSNWSWRLLAVVAALVVLVFAISKVAVVATSVFVSVVLASVLWLPMNWLRRRLKFPPSLASAVVLIGFLGVIGGIGWLLYPAVTREVANHGAQLAEQSEQLLDELAARAPLQVADGSELIEMARKQIAQRSSQLASFAAAGAAAVGGFVTGLLLTIALTFFFLRDGDRMVRWMLERTTSARREDVRAVLDRAWFTLRRFVGGTAIVAMIDAVGIGFGLWVIGVPLVLPLAVLTFFASFLPIIGAVMAGFVAVLVALGSKGVTAALLTLLVVLGVQQFESNVLEPVVLGRAVPLHPVVIMVAITAFGLVWGILGAFVAVPLAAVTSAVGNELRRRGMLGVRATGVA